MSTEQTNNQSVQNSAIAAIATASSTPFKTALKITLGIAVGQMLIGLMFMAGCSVMMGTAFYLTK